MMHLRMELGNGARKQWKKIYSFQAILEYELVQKAYRPLVILYDRLVNEVAKHDICMIYHADMYLCPGALDSH